MNVLQKSMSLPKMSWINQIARSVVLKKFQALPVGCIEFTEDYNGHHHRVTIGQKGSGDLVARITVKNPNIYPRVAFGGTVGAGEGYAAGEWESDDLTQVVRVFVRNREFMEAFESGTGALLQPFFRLFHLLHRNSFKGARKNISAHYDLGNDFFELFLDPTWMYSSAFFKSPEDSLESAQVEKLDRICRKLKLSPSDHVLEIGSGWGGFALHAAKNYGCRITTVTISEKQFERAQSKIKEAGLDHLITIQFRDYRKIEGKFDKLVSIEMIEAVGLDLLPTYFECCNRFLNEGGEFLLQAITIRDQFYESAKDNVDFIQRYIFPGSGIPSVSAMMDCVRDKTEFALIHQEDFGQDYARTLKAWSEQLKHNHAQVLARGYSDHLYRLWQYYFSYCEGGFIEQAIGVSQLHFKKQGFKLKEI